MKLQLFKAAFLLGILTVFVSGPKALAGDASINVMIQNFAGSHYWRAAQSFLVPTKDGRYKTKDAGAFTVSGTCGDMLAAFQKRGLDVMLSNQYISPNQYHILMNELGSRLDPRQLLLVTIYSDLKRSDVIAEFDKFNSGKPKEKQENWHDRVMREWNEKGEQMVRLSRGSLYAVRGQIPEAGEDGKVFLKPLKLPWEMDEKLGSHLERAFDRSKIKALVEVGRAHSESDIYPGDFKLLSKVLSTTLETEFHFLNVPADEVLLTAHFLDAQHTRFFTGAFPLRPLTSQIQTDLENNLEATLSNYLVTFPRPKGREAWKDMDDTVTFASLSEWVKQFPPESISDAAYELAKRSNGKLKPAEALHLFTEFSLVGLQNYDFYFENFPKSRGPLMVRDMTLVTGSLIAKSFAKFGLEDELLNPRPNGVQQWISTSQIGLHMDAFSEYWIDRYILVPTTNGQLDLKDSILVTNLDNELANKYPGRYLGSVILAIYDLYRSHLNEDNSAKYAHLLKIANAGLRNRGKPPMKDLDPAWFFDAFPISVNSSDPQVREQLRVLGGTPLAGGAVKIDIENQKHTADIKEMPFFQFRYAQLQALAQRFPDLTLRGKRRLKPAAHRERLLLLQSHIK